MELNPNIAIYNVFELDHHFIFRMAANIQAIIIHKWSFQIAPIWNRK